MDSLIMNQSGNIQEAIPKEGAGGRRVGLLGGTFDPIHNGHLHMAESACQEYALDEIWLIPTGRSPHKDSGEMTDAWHRLQMCGLAIGARLEPPAVRRERGFLSEAGCLCPKLRVSSIEVDASEICYTYRTLGKLDMIFPNDTFYFIMGADSLDYFDRWVHPELICQYAKLLVVNRDEFSEKDLWTKINDISGKFPARIAIVHCSKYAVSSHEIRDAIGAGEDCSDLLPETVAEYIVSQRLYAAS